MQYLLTKLHTMGPYIWRKGPLFNFIHFVVFSSISSKPDPKEGEPWKGF